MSWGEVKKINSDLSQPLDKLLHKKNLLRRDIVVQSSNWVAPIDGYYYVTCIGKGGTGALNIGGGSGAISRSKLYLPKGTVIALTVNDTVSSFGPHLSATAAVNATGGTASGGNVFNLNGITATNGNGASTPISSFSLGGIGPGGNGGGGYIPLDIIATFGNNSSDGHLGGTGGGGGGGATYNTSSPGYGGKGVMYGGNGGNGGAGGHSTNWQRAGGSGGGGGGSFGGGGGGFNNPYNWYPGTPGTGGAGAVIIEYME